LDFEIAVTRREIELPRQDPADHFLAAGDTNRALLHKSLIRDMMSHLP